MWSVPHTPGGPSPHLAPSLCFMISVPHHTQSSWVTPLLSGTLAARIPLAAEKPGSADPRDPCPVLRGCPLCSFLPAPPRIKALRPLSYL